MGHFHPFSIDILKYQRDPEGRWFPPWFAQRHQVTTQQSPPSPSGPPGNGAASPPNRTEKALSLPQPPQPSQQCCISIFRDMHNLHYIYYIYIFKFIYIYIFEYKYKYTYIYMYKYIHMYLLTHTHTYIYILTYISIFPISHDLPWEPRSYELSFPITR